MDGEILARALKMYGSKAVSWRQPEAGYRNHSYAFSLDDGSERNLILYKREPDILATIKRANYVSDFLASRGWPTRRTADTRILRLNSSTSTAYAALYNYLPGSTIPWEAYTMEHLKQLGASLAGVHAALAALEQSTLPNVSDEYLALARKMEDYFARRGVRSALANKLDLLAPTNLKKFQLLLEKLAGTDKAQALHMDFVRGNILFAGKPPQISGILDFEEAAWGAPIFDIARTLAFLLVDCKYKPDAKIRKYFLYSGYAKRGQGTLDSVLLEPLVDFCLMHDFYKFLRHNPYEFLSKNEHFIRTRDLALARGLITPLTQKC